MKLIHLAVLAVLQIWSIVKANPTIKLYGDVLRNYEFFAVMFPYLMDNFGGFLNVEYNILGHGIYAASQLCALKQLSKNNFLAAYYLQCEAEGRHPETCLCESGIDEAAYRSCVRTEGNALAKKAYWNYAQPYGSDWTPVIDFGNIVHQPDWSIKGNQNSTVYFAKFCALFVSEKRPFICSVPLHINPQQIGATRFDDCNNPEIGDKLKPLINKKATYRTDNHFDVPNISRKLRHHYHGYHG